MKLNIFLLLFLVLAIFLQQIFFSFPLVFLLSYILIARNPEVLLITAVLILTLISDASLNQPIGATMGIAVLANLGVFFYSRFLGSKDTLVYVLIGLIAAFIYAIIFEYSLQALFNWYIVFLVIWIIYKLIPRKYISL